VAPTGADELLPTRAATHQGRIITCAAVKRSTFQPASLRYACRSRSRMARRWVRCASRSYSMANRIDDPAALDQQVRRPRP